MKRRRLLGAVAALATGTAGCLGRAGGGTAGSDGEGAVPDDRTVVDETFAAGPTEPRCSASGKPHYPPMSRRRSLVDDVPDGRDPNAVAAFVRANTRISDEVTISPRKYAALAWRNERVDLADRYDSARYYVGWVGDREDGHTLLVVVRADYTELTHYETGENC